MKLLIATGGGGHFAPALSVIEILKDTEILLVGRKYGLEGDSALSLEYQTAQSLDIPFANLTTGRLQRSVTRHTIPSLLKMPIGFFEAFRIVRSFKPDVILSFGGYVSVPVVIAGSMLGVPVVIHEQTLEAGLANKIAAAFARTICISWESSRRFFPKEKTILTGNPLRQFSSVATAGFSIPNGLPIIYITGGSLGAHAINALIEGCIEKLLTDYVVIHQTGDAKQYNDFNRLTLIRDHLHPEMKKRYMLTKFIPPHDVGGVLEKADLVIARAGINTVTELLFFGKPSLLIPLPISQKQEQAKNAQFFVSFGIGEMVLQKDLTPEKLYTKIVAMVENIDTYKKHRSKAKEVMYPDASKRILDVVKKAAL